MSVNRPFQVGKICFILLFFLGIPRVKGQDFANIFHSFSDFNNYISQVPSNRKKLPRVNFDVFIKPHQIKVIGDNNSVLLDKKMIWGYVGEDGSFFRVKDDSLFQILNPFDSIVIYRFKSFVRSKGDVFVNSYFFGLINNSEILPLSKNNLMALFKENDQIVKQLDLQFYRDEDLIEFDVFCRCFKLIKLINEI